MKRFYEGIDGDIGLALKEQVRDLWTYNSAAFEENDLTLSETAFVLREGLTIPGKKIRNHEEVCRHAKAIEMLYGMLDLESMSENEFFELHKAIQIRRITDNDSPAGAWRKSKNGAYEFDGKACRAFKYYTAPEDIPFLMGRWISSFNKVYDYAKSVADALKTHAFLHMSFARIHPFYDGNGKMARLISNIPLLKIGQPPVIISNGRRDEYARIMRGYELAVGAPSKNHPDLLPPHPATGEFLSLVSEEWKHSIRLVQRARKEQEKRKRIVIPPSVRRTDGMRITP